MHRTSAIRLVEKLEAVTEAREATGPEVNLARRTTECGSIHGGLLMSPAARLIGAVAVDAKPVRGGAHQESWPPSPPTTAAVLIEPPSSARHPGPPRVARWRLARLRNAARPDGQLPEASLRRRGDRRGDYRPAGPPRRDPSLRAAPTDRMTRTSAPDRAPDGLKSPDRSPSATAPKAAESAPTRPSSPPIGRFTPSPGTSRPLGPARRVSTLLGTSLQFGAPLSQASLRSAGLSPRNRFKRGVRTNAEDA